MTDLRQPNARSPQVRQTSALRHWTGFVFAGAVAFSVDSAILMLLTRLLHVPVLVSRLIAITLAMVASWLINRTITFPVDGRPTRAEFARFAAVGWAAAAVNYGIFALLILAWPSLHPVAAIAIASLFAMTFAYLGMRFGVFRR